ncbi:NAD(P)/FAD-dependent oxidoreductase [Candidatus Woesearchaeota archaeon]|nr:NAD(P)/FAD-dependent oxidoreductase [Candidatus Woesearchaeota archaeon]
MVSIIGAGPAGCYTASLLAEAGKDVQLFEEHKEIGSPVRCTGLVTSSIKEVLKPKESSIMNRISDVRIISKNTSLDLKLKEKNLVLDRKSFDNDLADLAIAKGAKIFLNCRFIDNKKNLIKVSYSQKKETILKTDYLIGADGPLSSVEKRNFPENKKSFMTGLQAIVRLKNDNCIEFYPSLGTFSWVVPENKEICRIGSASYTNPKYAFKELLKLKSIENKSIIEKQGGLIPLYDPKLKTKKDNVFLVGDAASQVKATTGGGIIQGLKAAGSLASSIIKQKDYEKGWKKEIGKGLWLHLKMRSIMDKFKDDDWNHLIETFKKDKPKDIIESFDRDHPTKLMSKLVLNEPRLLCFLKFLF